MSKTSEIVLALHQSADTSTCGSCWFFDRAGRNSEYDTEGACTFKMPPTREYARQQWDAETQPLNTVKDTERCDFWRSSGRTYIVSQRLKP